MEFLTYLGLAVIIFAVAWLRGHSFARRVAPRGKR